MRAQLARIHQVLGGHSDRALVHAIDAEGREYKLEVPADAARGLSSGHVLWIAWTAHTMPATLPAPTQADAAQADAARAEAQTTSSSGAQTPDEQFVTLMGLRSSSTTGSATSPKAAPSESGRSTQDLAELLGVRLSESRRA